MKGDSVMKKVIIGTVVVSLIAISIAFALAMEEEASGICPNCNGQAYVSCITAANLYQFPYHYYTPVDENGNPNGPYNSYCYYEYQLYYHYGYCIFSCQQTFNGSHTHLEYAHQCPISNKNVCPYKY